MRAWLDAEGDQGLVIEAACRWIATNWHRQEAVYLTKELSKLKSLPAATVKDILRWCCHFPEDEDTLWRLTQLFHHLDSSDLDLPFVVTTAIVLESRLVSGKNITPDLEKHLRLLFCNVGGIGLASTPLRPACDRLQQIIFRDKRTFAKTADAPFVRMAFLVDLVLTLVHVGRLDLTDEIDREAFRRFVSWLATWDDEEKVWARTVSDRNLNIVSDSDLRQELLDVVQPRMTGTPTATQTAA
jgi:hypothetical protein